MNAGTGNLSLAKNLISVKVINNKTHEKLEIEKKISILSIDLALFKEMI